MALITLIYGSSATDSFSETELVPLLQKAREKNSRLNVTGMLLYRDGNFLQVLEGEAETVEGLYETISKDPRHRSVLTFMKRTIPEREFSEWQMGFVNLGDVDASQLPGYSDYLDVPLDSDSFKQDGFAATFLGVFKQIVR
ncbi:MAG: BLUF domain-containing protein [Chloroflexota bacterium]